MKFNTLTIISTILIAATGISGLPVAEPVAIANENALAAASAESIGYSDSSSNAVPVTTAALSDSSTVTATDSTSTPSIFVTISSLTSEIISLVTILSSGTAGIAQIGTIISDVLGLVKNIANIVINVDDLVIASAQLNTALAGTVKDLDGLLSGSGLSGSDFTDLENVVKQVINLLKTIVGELTGNLSGIKSEGDGQFVASLFTAGAKQLGALL